MIVLVGLWIGGIGALIYVVILFLLFWQSDKTVEWKEWFLRLVIISHGLFGCVVFSFLLSSIIQLIFI